MTQEIFAMEYPSPVGLLTAACDKEALLGLWMEHQKYFCSTLGQPPIPDSDTPVLRQTRQWLDAYFQGKAPSAGALPLRPQGSPFRQKVWNRLCQIPYGQTVTYGQIATEIAVSDAGLMSAQAVGGAVGHNPICIIIPCHRVLGAGAQLTGYAGGLDKKRWLLRHEGVHI